MFAVVEQPEALQKSETRSEPTRHDHAGVYGKYLLCVLLVTVLLYPLPLLLVRLPSYERWATSEWGPMLEYSFDTRPKNADVVIFGDSSAFLGVDPRIVNAQLGIHSIVLPDTVGSIPVTRDEPLRSYLAHNPRPRLIVLYFSPWNLDFEQTAKGRLFEGEEMLLRHMSWHDIARFERRHPLELPEFPFKLYSTFGPKIVMAALHHVNREEATAQALGHADYTEPFPPLQQNCVIPSEYLSHKTTASTQDLIRRYSTAETEVMVYLAPIPNCRNSRDFAQHAYGDLRVDPPQLLPSEAFAGDPYYAHLEPSSVATASLLLGDALKKHLQNPRLPMRPVVH